MRKHPVPRDWLSLLSVAILAAAVVAVVIVRIEAASVPLERDEGEYALMGQLILDGIPPYSEASNMKLPGIYYAYSAILAIFGQTVTGIHFGLLAVNLISTFFLYLIARTLLGPAGAAMAGAAYIIMSADNSVLGLFAHATQFVMMFALAGIWMLQKSLNFAPLFKKESNGEAAACAPAVQFKPGLTGLKLNMLLLSGSGLCLGFAILMKQSGVFFALFGIIWYFYEALRSRPIVWKRILIESGSLTFGIIFPYFFVLALMIWQGVFDKFWFWTVDYVRAYASEMNLKTGIELFKFGFIPIVRNNPLLWLMALAGIIGVLSTESGRRIAPFTLSFFLFSFLSVCPGFFFREHYFVQLLPAAALNSGAAVSVLGKTAERYTSRSRLLQFSTLLTVVAISLTGTFSTGRVLANSTPGQFSRSIYGVNPFPESLKISEYLRKNTTSEERIAVIGSEPQICFYAHRRLATEHIYMYGLMEPQPFALRMQEEMIAQVEKCEPRFVVLATAPGSWLQRPNSEKKLLSWIKDFINNFYQPVVVADIFSDRTLWLTGKEAESFKPRTGSSQLIVFKRKFSR